MSNSWVVLISMSLKVVKRYFLIWERERAVIASELEKLKKQKKIKITNQILNLTLVLILKCHHEPD